MNSTKTPRRLLWTAARVLLVLGAAAGLAFAVSVAEPAPHGVLNTVPEPSASAQRNMR
ncbi:hypothetical protein [Amycolatopsis xylanica]|uniref:hypothetical protein n=1 Tax=Amycolatopsis xylanica TaxID=589385 RepID=UPI0015A2F971|nr:hypothetical protein [Amycolatopsis xylanica]